MCRFALLGAAVAVVGFGLCAGAAGRPVEADFAAPLRMATAASDPFLGVLHASANSPAILARFDPLSLRPVSAQVLHVGEYHRAWSLSPDGLQLALATGGQGIGIRIVDLGALEVVREVQTGIAAEALAWLAPRLLVAALQRGGTVIVDPLTGRILRRWLGFSFPDASASTQEGLVMLLPPLRDSSVGRPLTRVPGAPRLAVVDAQARLRSVALERIRLAARFRNGMYYWGRAGLAVDPARGRAYVFGADAPVAQVDLRTMRVSYHRLEPLFLRPGELQGSEGQPKAALLARQRGALWLENGHVVVVGRDFVTARGRKEALLPAGAALVNPANWSWRTLDRSATGAVSAARRLLVYGPGWYPAAGSGLRAHTLGGRKVFSLFKGERVFDVQVAADWAYVRTPSAVYVVDVRSGKAVSKIAPPVDLVDVIIEHP